ncbi:MAG: DUF4175 domain-containing protein [Chitinophagales bacterium]|nr:DUF4175 domain-containing protein [Chitinophagales bacterium]
MGSSYTFLLERLDEFIRKYYLNKMLRGVLITTAIILVYFLFIVLAEYQFYFGTLFRKLLFFSFLGLSASAFILLVLQPIFKIYSLGERISHEKAAEIIGMHFNQVQDKLINILQLKSSSISLEDASLVEASIQQKSLELKPVPFSSAIDLQANKKYLPYALPPLFLFLLLLIIQPAIIKEGTFRLVQNSTEFEKPAPFEFEILNENLEALQFEDFNLQISLSGDAIPQEVFLVKNDLKNSTQKLNTNSFSYVFSNLQEDVSFHLEAAGFKSQDFILNVKAKPLISNFQVKLDFPEYLGMKNTSIVNSGDLSVPEGTKITWIFDAQATDKISMRFSDALLEQKNSGNNTFIFNKELKYSDKYIVKIFNNNVNLEDSSAFSISVIPDAFPEIEVVEHVDSSNLDVYYYIGKIMDDYGLRSLTFNYTIEKEGGEKKSDKVSIPFQSGNISEFSYYWNIREFNLEPGDKMSYFFQVWDNDKVNGSKSTRSKWMLLKLASKDELADNSEEELQSIKKELQSSLEESAKLQEELRDIQDKLMQKKDLEWQDKKELEQLINKQKDLQSKMENLEKKFDKNIKEQASFKQVNPEIKKKQEQVQKMFDAVLDEEMKAMIDKLEKMMEDLAKEDALEKMEDLEMSDSELEDELDRMLEMLKKLEFEQKMQETIDKLKELADKQEELAKDSRDKTKDAELLEKEQEALNKEFDKLKDDLEKMQEQNEDTDLGDAQEKAEDIDQQMDEAQDKLSKKQNSKAAEDQKDLSKKMKEMAQSLSDMMMDMQMASMEEDMESLRQLLENLVVLSLDEERLLQDFKLTQINTPRYVSLVQEQFKIMDDSKLVEDSLLALAKRVFEIESFIMEEIKDVNRNLDKAVDLLEERDIANATVSQQYVMTSYNNLALMLSEVMEQMQQQMAQKMEGNQMCENPGNKPGEKPGKKPGKIPSLKEMQQQLSDQISEMAEMMKEGSSKNSKSSQSQKLAEMAAKQQAIRQALEELNQSDNKDGKGSLGDLQKIIDEMNQTETDIVNKNISNELLNRQKDIMIRLLEAENAEKERDEKEERESISAKQYENIVPPSLEEYLKKQEGSISFYRNIPPRLKAFYRNISENYIQNVLINN